MDLVLGNPAGLWALLGAPAIVAIHFFHQRARPAPTSTLFLIERVGPERISGRRFERLRSSPQLWLQLAAVLLLTWLLASPRWLRADAVQRVVVLLDSSWSMAAFQAQLPGAVAEALAPLARTARVTEWRVQGTHSGAGVIYHGTRLDELRARLDSWHPDRGRHAFAEAVAAARSVAGAQGAVVLVTDHRPEEATDGVDLLGIGEPMDNCGFTGVRTDGEDGPPQWRTLLRNYGSSPAERAWRVEVDGAVSQQGTVRLGPGDAAVIQGRFPDRGDRLWCIIEPDRFPLDDRLPIIRPRRKPLRVAVNGGPELEAFARRWFRVLDPVRRVPRGEAPDLELTTYAPGTLPDTTRNRVSFPRPDSGPGGPDDAPDLVVPADHPLTRGLVWRGLLCRPLAGGSWAEDDEVLLWQGSAPLAVLRSRGDRRQLILAFDPTTSNALRIPAFVLMLHRFAESVRDRLPAPEARNVELNQPLDIAALSPGPPVSLRSAVGAIAEGPLPSGQAALLRAPDRPAFFTVVQGDDERMRGAAAFADVHEADLSAAASFNRLGPRVQEAARRHSRPDPWTPLWTVLLAAAVMGSWAAGRD